MDLSKAFDCLSHELIIAKSAAYRFKKSVLKVMYSHLFDRKQKTKINNFYSASQEILLGFLNVQFCISFFQYLSL